MGMAELKLTIDLIPKTSWYRNLRTIVGRRRWDGIRRQVYAAHDHRCAICGAEGQLNCHEIWCHDDDHGIQELVGFTALCNMCHHVKHFGQSQILAAQGHLDIEKVVEHFMRVNQCDRDAFDTHVRTAFALWHRRSQREWTVELGEYAPPADS